VIGDDSFQRRVLSIVSFDTASIPDAAVIDVATLTLKSNGAVAGQVGPLYPIHVDLQTGTLGSFAALETSDFQAAATIVRAASSNLVQIAPPPPPPQVFAFSMDASGRAAINKQGLTQFRVYFDDGTDGDAVADGLGFSPGESSDAELRPTLLIKYH
jgi:hypothetical protein